MNNSITDEIIKRAAIVFAAFAILLLCVVFNYFITEQKARADKIRLERQIEEVKAILEQQKEQLDEPLDGQN